MQLNKILVVEDEPLINRTTCLLLNNEKIFTFSAYNGAEGLSMAKSKKPDLILLDLILPDMHGWDVLRALKYGPLTQDIPVVLFTATNEGVSEKYAHEKGAAGLLHKPFFPHQLFKIAKTL